MDDAKNEGSVTHWLSEIQAGDADAAQALCNRYFTRLVVLARRGLSGVPTQMADEEDVALSVFHSFYRAIQVGRYPNLADRDDLWRLLVRMTARKVIDRSRYENRLRRSRAPTCIDEERQISQAVGQSPTPEFAVAMAEQFTELLNCLGDPILKELAIGKMEGFTNDELAERMQCSVRTIERRLAVIRRKIEFHTRRSNDG